MKRSFLFIFCVTLIFSLSTISASAVPVASDSVAAFIRTDITLNSGEIYGDTYHGGLFSVSNSGSNLMSGNIYRGPEATVDFKVAEQHVGEIIDLQAAIFPSELPSIAMDLSAIPPHAEQDYKLKNSSPDITTSWSFNSIDLIGNRTLVIDTTAGDVVLVTNTLKGNGDISITGNNRVAIIVNEAISGTIRTDNTVHQDNLYLFINNGDYNLPSYDELSATVIMKNGTFNVNGSIEFNGILISDNAETNTISGNATINGQYYTPNANIELSGSATFNGMIEANSLSIVGDATLNYGVGSLSLPPAFFGSTIPDPSMVLPLAPVIVTPDDHVAGLKVEYFDTITPQTYSKRLEDQINSVFLNCGIGSPDPVIDSDTFSVKFTGYIKAPETGSYTFYTLSDDGAQVQIDGQTLISRLEDINLEFTEGTPISLVGATYYPLEVIYFENMLNSTLVFFYEKDGEGLNIVPDTWYYSDATTPKQYFNSINASGNGLNIWYYNSIEAASNGGAEGTALPAAISIGNVNMEVYDGSPHPDINNDHFSVVYEGYLEAPYDGDLDLAFIVDDGIKVYVDNVLILNEWEDHSYEFFTMTIPNANHGQKYKLRIEYYENVGSATCIMGWPPSDNTYEELVPLKYLYTDL